MSKTTYTLPDNVRECIESEREHQNTRWPEQNRSTGEWLLIMEKCLLDAKHAWIAGHGGDMLALQEIRQATACGVAAMEQHGCYPRLSRH